MLEVLYDPKTQRKKGATDHRDSKLMLHASVEYTPSGGVGNSGNCAYRGFAVLSCLCAAGSSACLAFGIRRMI